MTTLNIPEDSDRKQSLPPGKYTIRFQDGQIKHSETSGNLMLQVETVIEAQPSSCPVNGIGWRIRDYLTITEKSIWKLSSALKAATGEGLKAGPADDREIAVFANSRLTGRTAIVEIVHNEKGYPSIARYIPKNIGEVAQENTDDETPSSSNDIVEPF